MPELRVPVKRTNENHVVKARLDFGERPVARVGVENGGKGEADADEEANEDVRCAALAQGGRRLEESHETVQGYENLYSYEASIRIQRHGCAEIGMRERGVYLHQQRR